MTIVDIAKESGYSISTVSRVLNNRQDVSPVAREKIMAIVEAHRFVPNNNAKHLKQVSARSILVIAKGTSNMLFANIIEEIQHMMESAELSVDVHYLDEDDNEVLAAVRLCRERKPLGVLFMGGNPEYFKADFEEVDVPCVLATTSGEELGFKNLASTSTDDVSASRCAVDYLLENGHTAIGVLGGNPELSHTSGMRLQGCLESFAAHGIDFDREKYYERARFSFESAYRAMGRLLDKKLPLTAVFAMSDVMAIGAIRAVCDRGMNVPEDISIVGFDGTLLADFYNPKIVTIRQDYKTIATRSVELLLQMIDLKKDAVHEVIPFSLTKGESVKNRP